MYHAAYQTAWPAVGFESCTIRSPKAYLRLRKRAAANPIASAPVANPHRAVA
jgi:hypothetical protein